MPPGFRCLRARRLLPRTIAALAFVAVALTAARAGSPAADAVDEDPNSSRRVVHLFTFEEQDPNSPDFNPDPVPRYWFRAQDDAAAGRSRPGFPPWNAAEFDRTVAASGTTSVRLEAAGGSASLRLMPGAIPVFPGADYIVSAMVRTADMKRSRAFLTARFLDASRRPIAGSETRSEPQLCDDQWTPVSIELRGDHPNASFLQIDLELLQRRAFDAAAVASLRHHSVLLDDIHARAWFDDVTVVQIPRTEIGAASPLNIAVAPDQPVLRFSIRDMAGDDLEASITIRDVDDRVISSTQLPINAGGRSLEWAPRLPKYGWYTAVLHVSHRGQPVALAQTRLIWLPPTPHQRPLDIAGAAMNRRFGLAADDAPPGVPAWPAFLPHAVRAVGTGFIILPHADPTVTADELSRSLVLTRTPLDDLLEQQQEVTLSFAAVPPSLATSLRIDPRDTLALAGHPESTWRPFLLPVLERYGQRNTRWQINPTSSAPLTAAHADLPGSIDRFATALSRLVPGLVISVPWVAASTRGLPLRRASELGGITLLVPADAPPGTIAEALSTWAGSGGRPEVTLVLQSARGQAGGAPRRRSLDALVIRTLEAITAIEDVTPPGAVQPAIRLAVDQPWSWLMEPRPAAVPEPELAVWRTILDHLAGRTVVTELPVAPGVRCVLLTDPDPATSAAADPSQPLRGALLAWNESAEPGDAVLRAYLGENPLFIVDIFGNSSPVPRPAESSGAYAIPIPASPIFIEGVDPRIVRFLAAFRIDPPLARAVLTEHEHSFVLENPWPIRISGQLQIISPEQDRSGWTISPRGVTSFTIAPGAEARVPLSFSFGAREEAGRKHFGVLIRLTADRTYPAQLLTAPLEIGSEDLELRCTIDRSPGPGGPDLIIVANVHNRGRHPRTLRLEAFAPRYPSQQAPISDLAPGEHAVRRFLFKGAAEPLTGRRILISLSDTDAPERLNTSVVAP